MAAPRPWAEQDAARLVELHAAGRSLHSIATDLGRSKDTISRKAAAAGLTWDRSKTAAAAQAVVVDNKARRALLVSRHYARAEKVLDRLEAATFTTLVPVGMGEQRPQALEFVPAIEEKALAQAVSTYLTSAARLEQIDAGDGSDTVRSLLGSLARTLGLAPEHDTAA